MKTWITKDGTELNIKDMETSHIKNCIKYLESQEIPVVHYMGDCHVGDIIEDTDAYIVAFEKELKIREEVENLWI